MNNELVNPDADYNDACRLFIYERQSALIIKYLLSPFGISTMFSHNFRISRAFAIFKLYPVIVLGEIQLEIYFVGLESRAHYPIYMIQCRYIFQIEKNLSVEIFAQKR